MSDSNDKRWFDKIRVNSWKVMFTRGLLIQQLMPFKIN